MRVAIVNASEEHGQYVGQVYQQHYAKLRQYFFMQLGDASEADACVQETFNHFFFFMEDRCWEADVEYMPVYLMRIAGGLVCSKKLAGKKARRRNRRGSQVTHALFHKLRNEVLQPFKEGFEFMRLFLRVGATAGSRG
ncbi:MAG: hypothetical protein M3444_17805 [Acidobacteriota bacterium]|nr:hypothetical protein [Acidobacteriota bacterium]MDQ5837246.1 hypothetical protein [Acidobacteriota bacterium]